MIRTCAILLIVPITALSQQPPPTVPPGIPLRAALEYRVPIQHPGQPVYARLIEPVYLYDRIAIPAGTVVVGHIAQIEPVPAWNRIAAFMSGNFTPPHRVQAQFDALILSDGARLPLHTSPSRGTPHTARVAKPRAGAPALNGIAGTTGPAILAFKEPGKIARLRSRLFEMLPYRRQSWPVGTLFNAALQQPLALPSLVPFTPPTVEPGAEQELRARLLTPLTSATARRGSPVQAYVTQPLFSSDRALLIPEGSLLSGSIVEARRARFFHRGGKLLFVFRELKLPARPGQPVQGQLDGIEADFNTHLALDSEGAAHIASPKTRFLFPAIAAAVAGLSFHQDYNAQGIPDADSAGRAESGAVGLGLLGTLLAQIGPRSVASGFAVAGAAFSMYNTFIARGPNVVLPVNTPIQVSLGKRDKF